MCRTWSYLVTESPFLLTWPIVCGLPKSMNIMPGTHIYFPRRLSKQTSQPTYLRFMAEVLWQKKIKSFCPFGVNQQGGWSALFTQRERKSRGGWAWQVHRSHTGQEEWNGIRKEATGPSKPASTRVDQPNNAPSAEKTYSAPKVQVPSDKPLPRHSFTSCFCPHSTVQIFSTDWVKCKCIGCHQLGYIWVSLPFVWWVTCLGPWGLEALQGSHDHKEATSSACRSTNHSSYCIDLLKWVSTRNIIQLSWHWPFRQLRLHWMTQLWLWESFTVAVKLWSFVGIFGKGLGHLLNMSKNVHGIS